MDADYMSQAVPELFRYRFIILEHYVAALYNDPFHIVVKRADYLQYLFPEVNEPVDLTVCIYFKLGYPYGIIADPVGMTAFSASAVERDTLGHSFRERAQSCYLFEREFYSVINELV